VAVLRSLEVDRLSKVELLDNDTRSHVKVGLDDLNQLLGGLVRGPIGINLSTVSTYCEDAKIVRHT
jgi:hypothetical protein